MYTGAHVIEAFILGMAVAGFFSVMYYRRWSKWAAIINDKVRGK
jgi:hypothetical protein